MIKVSSVPVPQSLGPQPTPEMTDKLRISENLHCYISKVWCAFWCRAGQRGLFMELPLELHKRQTAHTQTVFQRPLTSNTNFQICHEAPINQTHCLFSLNMSYIIHVATLRHKNKPPERESSFLLQQVCLILLILSSREQNVFGIAYLFLKNIVFTEKNKKQPFNYQCILHFQNKMIDKTAGEGRLWLQLPDA